MNEVIQCAVCTCICGSEDECEAVQAEYGTNACTYKPIRQIVLDCTDESQQAQTGCPQYAFCSGTADFFHVYIHVLTLLQTYVYKLL